MTPEEEKNQILTPLAPQEQAGVRSITGVNAPNFWKSMQNDNNPTTVATQTGEKTGSSTSTTTSTTTVSPYDKWKNVSGLDDIIDRLQKEVDAYKPETKEEREERERRERRTGFLARLADGLGTLHTAYSHARGVKPMEMPQMSARATELFEKAKAEREREKDRVLNLALQLGKLKDARDRQGYEITKQEQEEKWKQQQAATQKDQWQKKYDADQEQAKWQRAHGDRQLDLAEKSQAADERNDKERNAQGWARIKMEREQMKRAQQSHPDYAEFTLGGGRGTIRVPKAAINSYNFAAVFNTLPEDYRKTAGEPVYSTDRVGNKVISGYSNPTPEQMEIAVGKYLNDDKADALQQEATRYALSQIGTRVGGSTGKTKPQNQKGKYSSFSIH